MLRARSASSSPCARRRSSRARPPWRCAWRTRAPWWWSTASWRPSFRSSPQTTFAYRFNHTLNDLVWSSWVRTFHALASHAASRLDNLYTPYLFVSATLLARVRRARTASRRTTSTTEATRWTRPSRRSCSPSPSRRASRTSPLPSPCACTRARSSGGKPPARAGVLGFRFSKPANCAASTASDARLRRPFERARDRARRRDRTTGHEKTRVSQIRLTGTSPRARWRTSTAGSATIGVRIHYKDSRRARGSARERPGTAGTAGSSPRTPPWSSCTASARGRSAGARSRLRSPPRWACA